MNAPGAHYVANADAKIQPFFLTAITLRHFFCNNPLLPYPNRTYFQTITHKEPANSHFVAIFV